MGLFDGLELGEQESTARIARLLHSPVILVINTTRMTQSVAAMVTGYQHFQPDTNIAGVILNNVSGSRHEHKLVSAMEKYCGIPVVGIVPKDESLNITERHLGLVPYSEAREEAVISQIHRRLEERLNLDSILGIARRAKASCGIDTSTARKKTTTVKLGVMFDSAFTFYYPENLEALTQAGAELFFIDSIHDHKLPDIENVITLSALALAVGMVVDDAIVVVDSIVRHLEKGAEPVAAARDGALDVAGPDASGTLTTVAAFAPLLFLGGLAGLFVRPFGLTVSAALSASLLISLTFVPATMGKIGRTPGAAAEGGRRPAFMESVLRRILTVAFAHPVLTLLIALLPLGLGGLAAWVGPLRVLPPVDEGALLIEYIMPPGTSLAESDRVGGILVRTALAEEGVKTVYRRTGSPETGNQVEGAPEAREMVKPFHLPFFEKAYRGCDRLVPVSESLLTGLRSLMPWIDEKVEVIPNMIREEMFLPPQQPRTTDPFIFFWAGRLEHVKGVDLLLWSVADLKTRAKGAFRVRLAGRGSLRNQLEQQAASLGLEEEVRFLGRISREEMQVEMQRASCFVLPTRYEAFGAVLIEAMATGLPVIATRSGGPEHVVPGEAGFLIDPDDAGQLTDAMLRMMKEYSRFRQERIRSLAVKRFGEKSVMKRYHQLFLRLINSPSDS